MATLVPFIDRENELALIEKLVGAWGTRRILCIQAGGGIGKTRLLQEVRTRYTLSDYAFALDGVERKDVTLAFVHEFVSTEWAEEFIGGVRGMVEDLDVRLIETNANFDLDKMVTDLDAIIDQNPNVIVVRLGSDERLRPGIERAIQRGIKVLTFDNYLQQIPGLSARITLSESEGAHLSLDRLVEDIGFQGKVAALMVAGVAMQERRKGILDTVLSKYPDVQVVTEYSVMGPDMVEAIYHKTTELLRNHPDLKAIWVTWDEFTRGVIRALMDAGRSDVLVYSFDLCPSDVELMARQDSPWVATVAVNPVEVGRIIVRLAMQTAYGFEIRPHYSIPMEFITQIGLRKLLAESAPIWRESSIGWTPWLKTLSSTEGPKQRLLVTEIVDFDDRSFHIPQNLGYKIARMLDAEKFESYLRAGQDLRKMELAGVSAGQLAQQKGEVDTSFVTCFNNLADEQRILLFMDTVESPASSEVWIYLTEKLCQLQNFVLLLSGRNASDIGVFMKAELGDDVQIIDLPPLQEEASALYLQRKQQLMNIVIEPELAQKILLLAQGHPILIDLAVEWRAREIPLDWLVESRVEELAALTPDERQARQATFEAQLVRHIAETRQPIDSLTLMMSRVYPLDVDMLVELLKLPWEEAAALFEVAKKNVFVKSLPDGRLSLHDEIRRMVNQYVWPMVDPDADRRLRDSRLAKAYLHHEIEALTQRTAQLEATEQTARQTLDARTELATFVEREALERNLWTFKEQYLYHTMFTDVQQGVEFFVAAFDQATQAYRFSFRESLLRQMIAYVETLDPEQRYQVEIRQSKHLIDNGQHTEARDLLEKMAARPELQPQQRIETLIQLANVQIRLGKLQDGIQLFKDAVRISYENGEKAWIAKAETGLGWAYRLTAAFRKAGEHYETALDLAMELRLKKEQALLYNNLGFVYAYYEHIPNHRDKAEWFCHQSLAIAEELDDKRGQGSSYSTLGCITYMEGQFDRALTYFQKAIDIFEPADDREWLSTVYSWRAAVYMSMDNFPLAERDLFRSLEMGIQKDRPLNLSRLANLYIRQRRLDKAQEAIDECRRLALSLPDVLYQLVSLRYMARLAFYRGEYDRLGEFEQLLDEYFSKWEARDLRALGTLYLYLGRLALGKSDIDAAIVHLKSGLKLTVQYGRYANDTPQGHILGFEEAMVNELKLTPAQIRGIGTALLDFWKAQGLNALHPDVRILLSKWAKWEGA